MIAWNLEVVMEMTSKPIQGTRDKTDKTDLMNLTWVEYNHMIILFLRLVELDYWIGSLLR